MAVVLWGDRKTQLYGRHKGPTWQTGRRVLSDSLIVSWDSTCHTESEQKTICETIAQLLCSLPISLYGVTSNKETGNF